MGFVKTQDGVEIFYKGWGKGQPVASGQKNRTSLRLGSEETMRRSFLRLLSVTPQDYRARFSS